MNKEDKIPDDLLSRLEEERLSSPAARGKRAKILRRMTDLNRDQAAACHKGLNVNTMKSWEIGREGGLTAQGAHNLLEMVRSKGIFCHYEWLMFGIGDGPIFSAEDVGIGSVLTDIPTSKQREFIIDELRLLRYHHPAVVDLQIKDDGMEPFYSIEDHVAGIRLPEHEFEKALGRFCIVKLLDGKKYLRHIKPSKTLNRYNLICLNYEAKQVEKIVMEAIELLYLAPVIWHRKLNL